MKEKHSRLGRSIQGSKMFTGSNWIQNWAPNFPQIGPSKNPPLNPQPHFALNSISPLSSPQILAVEHPQREEESCNFQSPSINTRLNSFLMAGLPPPLAGVPPMPTKDIPKPDERVEYSNLPCPIPYEEIHREALS